MSRTNDVNIAMQCAKGGVVGALLMGLHKATIGWVVNTLAAEVERLEELHNSQLAGISTACLQNTEKSAADRITRDNPYWTVAYGDVCTAIDREMRERKRAETAEARVRELEAQYACKRYHGGEGPADDTLYSCQICGLTVDISKGHCEPTIEFTMQGRSDKKAKKVSELEAKNARLRAALEDVSLLAHCISKAGPLNTPDLETAWRKFDLISVKAAEALVDRKAALNGEEASK